MFAYVKCRFSHDTTHISSYSLLNMSRVLRKPAFCICENKDADQLRGNREANQRLCFRYIDSTLLPTRNFQASSHLVWLYSLVCVGFGRKPRRPVFSQQGSYWLYIQVQDFYKGYEKCMKCEQSVNCHSLLINHFCLTNSLNGG